MPSNLDKTRFDWADQEAKGPLRFVLVHGVVGWGVTTAVLYSLLRAIFEEGETFLQHIPSALIIFPIAGIFWGIMMWCVYKSRAISSKASSN